eukprot:TRINITY_DN17463_c0_g1_i2.p1 TRINITY_DN17463_c0_g1~~TRINITY_DN17463_c0_g1_i2.p1  ORF type:complete len:351 (+),score=85.54 TRINITY_DN17463_c0_g1_i2:64-1053(+)
MEQSNLKRFVDAVSRYRAAKKPINCRDFIRLVWSLGEPSDAFHAASAGSVQNSAGGVGRPTPGPLRAVSDVIRTGYCQQNRSEWGSPPDDAGQRLEQAVEWMVEQLERENGVLAVCTTRDVLKVLNVVCFLGSSRGLDSLASYPSEQRAVPAELRVRAFAALSRRLDEGTTRCLGAKSLADVMWLSSADSHPVLWIRCARRVIARPAIFDSKPYHLVRVLYAAATVSPTTEESEEVCRLLIDRFRAIVPEVRYGRWLGIGCAALVAAGHKEFDLAKEIADRACTSVVRGDLQDKPRMLVAVVTAVGSASSVSLSRGRCRVPTHPRCTTR